MAPVTEDTVAPAARDSGAARDPGEPGVAEPDELVEDELLVEEISIDGMCGVY